MLTVTYGAMHFLVDFICAWAMFGSFLGGERGYFYILIYNFCAFALQMPAGTVLDLLRSRDDGSRRKWLAPGCAVLGAVLTVLGALTHPAVLGLGNALFHTGGGVDVTRRDFACRRGGRDLGVFVAPGAVGLYLGTLLGKKESGLLILLAAAGILAAGAGLLIVLKRRTAEQPLTFSGKTEKSKLPVLILCCFAVVILRSWTGFEAGFDWKKDALPGFFAVLAVAGGKAAGGFLAARFGTGKTVAVTLLLAAVCFLFGQQPVFGLAALLLFNMSMPSTLYLLGKHMPDMLGFSFGLLTFGLFLGFLPVYGELKLPIGPQLACAAGSVLSAALMLLGWKAVDRDRISA